MNAEQIRKYQLRKARKMGDTPLHIHRFSKGIIRDMIYMMCGTFPPPTKKC